MIKGCCFWRKRLRRNTSVYLIWCGIRTRSNLWEFPPSQRKARQKTDRSPSTEAWRGRNPLKSVDTALPMMLRGQDDKIVQHRWHARVRRPAQHHAAVCLNASDSSSVGISCACLLLFFLYRNAFSSDSFSWSAADDDDVVCRRVPAISHGTFPRKMRQRRSYGTTLPVRTAGAGVRRARTPARQRRARAIKPSSLSSSGACQLPPPLERASLHGASNVKWTRVFFIVVLKGKKRTFFL